jgi:hypothetical protein
MKQICRFILFLPTIFFLSCSFHPFSKDETPWLEMEKTSCRGQCPEYKVSFYSNARAIYEGYSFAPRTGRYYARLPEEKMKKLNDMVREAQLDSFRDSYLSLRPDLPTTYIRYISGGNIRIITDYDNAPAGLKKFEEELEKLTESLSWKKAR